MTSSGTFIWETYQIKSSIIYCCHRTFWFQLTVTS